MRLLLDDPLGTDAMLFNGLEESTGIPKDQLKFFSSVFAAFPLAVLHGYLPNGKVRHVYSIFWGVAFAGLCFQEDVMHGFITSAVSYALMCFLPPRAMLISVLVFTYAYMSCAHLYSMWYEYLQWKVDYTMAQMIMTVKIQTLAFSVYDGARPGAKFHPKSDNENDKVPPEEFPSLLEYFSYIYFYPAHVAGPCFTYKAYRDWSLGCTVVPSGRYAAAAWKFLGALFIVVINKGVAPMFSPDPIVEPLGTGKPSIMEYNVVMRLLYVWVTILLCRTKYFCVWYMTDTACILTGFGFNGKAKEGTGIYGMMFGKSIDSKGSKWDRCSNGNYFAVETAQNVKGVTDNWNMGVNNWLKNCAYFRAAETFGDRSQMPVFVTQVTSAFWHGFYPGYYLFFVSATLLTVAARNARNKLRPLFMQLNMKPAYDIITLLCTGLTVNCIGAPFVLLDWNLTLLCWKRLYFIPHLAAAAVYLLCLVLPAPAKTKKQ